MDINHGFQKKLETSQPMGHYWKIDTNWKINNKTTMDGLDRSDWHDSEDLLLNVLESTRWCQSRHVRPPGITQITRQRPHTMKNIALFLNHQTNHQKNKLPSMGFEFSFLYLDSGARNVWFATYNPTLLETSHDKHLANFVLIECLQKI